MRTPFAVMGLTITLLAGMSYAHGQRATEQFIPLGHSPGLSGRYTYIGQIASADAQQRTISVSQTGGSHTVKITDATRIWLDRSKLRQTALRGSFGDLKKGEKVEIKYQGNDREQPADWVKVEVVQR